MTNAWALLQRRRRSAGASPLVTYSDHGRDERTELSVTSLENAAAKIANALRDEFGLEPGSTIGLHLPLHWQRSAWCAGVWTAGCIVVPEGRHADLVVATIDAVEGLLGDVDGEIALVSLHPLGLPITDRIPNGAVDATVSVRLQPDGFAFTPPTDDQEALRVGGQSYTQRSVLAEGAERATRWGLRRGGRLLVRDDLDVTDGWLASLAVPLAADASIVLVSGADPIGDLPERENVTATAEPQP